MEYDKTMTKELLQQKKEYLNNISELKLHHAEILQHQLNPPTLEENSKETPPKTAFITPNYLYKEKIKETVLKKEQNHEKSLE